MLKVLICGDLHLSGKNPPERKDDLNKVQWEKIDNIVSIANKHGVPVICTGDVFETPLVSNRMMSTLGERLNKLTSPFYFVFGNHDLEYHNIDMLDQTSLGVMWLNNQNIKHISEFEGDYGRAWSYIDWKNPFHDPDAELLLAHRAIVNNDLISGNSWIMDDKNFCQPVSELTRYRIIICGHWHRSYEYFYQYAPTKDVYVLNPGVVCRRTIIERENPSVFLMDLDSNDQKATRIDLNAAPADLIMREESLKDTIKPHKHEITLFVEQLRNQRLSKHVSFIKNLMNILDNMDNQKSVDREMRDVISTVQQKKKGANG